MILTTAEQDHLIRLLRRAMATDEKTLKSVRHLQECKRCREDFDQCSETTKALYDRLNAEILTR